MCCRSIWIILTGAGGRGIEMATQPRVGQRAGHYDPQARQIVLHELVLKNKTTWQANFAVALGEACWLYRAQVVGAGRAGRGCAHA